MAAKHQSNGNNNKNISSWVNELIFSVFIAPILSFIFNIYITVLLASAWCWSRTKKSKTYDDFLSIYSYIRKHVEGFHMMYAQAESRIDVMIIWYSWRFTCDAMLKNAKTRHTKLLHTHHRDHQKEMRQEKKMRKRVFVVTQEVFSSGGDSFGKVERRYENGKEAAAVESWLGLIARRNKTGLI